MTQAEAQVAGPVGPCSLPTLDDAQASLAAFSGIIVSRETADTMRAFARAVLDESQRQNLISRATIDDFWSRHILDSAQLVRMVPSRDYPRESIWVDLGSGAGFPALVVAILTGRPVIMVESRRLRAAFLSDMAQAFVPMSTVRHQPVERVGDIKADIVSARAYAPLDRLFISAIHLATQKTIWILPRGQTASEEVETVAKNWQGQFDLVPSLTDERSAILVARSVCARRRQGARA